MGYGYRSFDGDFFAAPLHIIALEFSLIMTLHPAGTATNGSLTGETTAATLGARELRAC